MTEATVTTPPAKRSRRNHLGTSDSCSHSASAVLGTLEQVIPDIVATSLQDTSNWCSKTFGTLLEDSSTHDVVFKTSDGGSVGAHRAIVAAGSPVFRAMLYGNMKESSQKEIELPTTDTATLNKLLTFLYTGKIKVDSKCVIKILDAAHYFDIAPLETMLVNFIKSSLGVVNVFPIVAIATSKKFDQLLEHCLKYMHDQADEVVRHESFNSLSSEVILLFCKSSDLKIREIDLFTGVAKWYEHNQDQVPENVVKSIFQEIRYPLIPKADLVNIVRPTKTADPSLYTAALEYHLFPDKYAGPSNQTTDREGLSLCFSYTNVTSSYVHVDDTSEGILIRRIGSHQLQPWGLCAIQVYPTERQPVDFIVTINKSSMCNIHLITRSYEEDDPTIPPGSVTGGINIATFTPWQINGTVSIRDNNIATTFGKSIMTLVPKRQGIYLCIHMHDPGDEIKFSSK